MKASVKTYGIIQPILFRVDADSPYLIIVAGERRFKDNINIFIYAGVPAYPHKKEPPMTKPLLPANAPLPQNIESEYPVIAY